MQVANQYQIVILVIKLYKLGKKSDISIAT